MTTRLCKIIAIAKGVKSDATRRMTDLHRDVQKQPLLSGLTRTYQPRDDEGDQLPGESTKVQLTAPDVLGDLAGVLTRLFDVTYTLDHGNTIAKADVTAGDTVLLRDVPATYLLFLEKQLTDLHTFMMKLPVLDPAEEWTEDGAPEGCWRSEPARTMRSKKIPRNHVLAEATDKHAAQVQMYTEDVPVGDWTTVKISGALPARRVRQLTDRVTELQQAVKQAREDANAAEVPDREAGAMIFGWLFR